MKTYTADLHVHSKFSRATSKSLTPRHLAAWAEVKGVNVLATGDFTHPQWLELIRTELVETDNGLFRLRDSEGLSAELPWLTRDLTGAARFVLCTEISSIYKKGGKVRKNHNLVFMPSLDAAARLNVKLAQVGNLASDGRPILGLDARDLLEMVLETDDAAFLVPAHIWTPWFSLFGSKSGFDSIEDCFGDLAGEIFALETGLSSDPEMNWMWSALDRFSLVSNSDAHSGEKLAREVNLFGGEMSFSGMRQALRREAGPTAFLGTMEFFPEEGKYHLDGHRACNVVLGPRETAACRGICPVCGKPLTVGVLNRVFELADRAAPERPAHQPGFTSLVPLAEILSEILGCGASSKKVLSMYAQLVHEFGSELDIVQAVSVDALRRSSRLLAEAVRRMRLGLVRRQSGYDGEYGRIRMFTSEELLEFRHGRLLAVPATALQGQPDGVQDWRAALRPGQDTTSEVESATPNDAQRAAILAGPGPVLVLAGPGTGKTHTLMARVRHLLEQEADPTRVLIVTFTRRAARELKDRLQQICPAGATLPRADTLHALALEQWIMVRGQAPILLSEESARRVFAVANPHLRGKALKQAWSAQALAREGGIRVPDDTTRRYLDQKAAWNLVDYTDLLEFWAKRADADRAGFDHVLVDEVQDLSALQVQLVQSLTRGDGRGFFAIGDPDQAIYAFRGAVRDVEERLRERWPDLERIRLTHNYRSAQDILTLSGALFVKRDILIARKTMPASLNLFEAQSAEQEAAWIASRIRELVGGTGHWQADRGGQTLALGDIAVLVRFKALIGPIENALRHAGIPVAVPEAEPFFTDSRVDLLLRHAAILLGMPDLGGDELPICPEDVVLSGPQAMAAHLAETPPFDRVFWKTQAFLDLDKAYHALGGWREVLNMVQLETELGGIRAKAQKVQIMTLHAAKGLEFEAVFLPALEEGIVPFAGMDALLGAAPAGDEDREEERRLFYVGLTRAKRFLFLSHCAGRRVFGKPLRLGLSSLVRQLPRDMLRKSVLKQHVRRSERQLSLF